MAQPTSLPAAAQAGTRQLPPPAPPPVPSSPTKSLWKRLLNRSASAHPEEPVNGAPPQPTFPVVPLPAPDCSAALQAAEMDGRAPQSSRPGAGMPAPGPDGGAVSKTTSNSRRAPHRDVVPGLPRVQTFARQQSELRGNLLPTIPTPAERRGASADRRRTRSVSSPSSTKGLADPRISAPNVSFRSQTMGFDAAEPGVRAAPEPVPPLPPIPPLAAATCSRPLPADKPPVAAATVAADAGGDAARDGAASSQPAASSGERGHEDAHHADVREDARHQEAQPPTAGETAKEDHLIDTASMTSSEYERRIRYELEHVWILNLSMHFRDKSRREKFFVTYRQRPDLSRRVTISLDYRDAPAGSLEMDLLNTKLQRDKNEIIYEAIRESLADIQFYSTVTNLKLQTADGRLHVHVVEDTTEIIDYPPSHFVNHLGCRKVRESDVEFDSHMSGFVYKVRVHGRVLIKKEIPGPDSVDEFLYEVNALNALRDSQNVIELYGVVVGNDDRIKGLLISYAEQGALVDILYENNHGIPWPTRMRWARQIVHGLSEIHEAGFVQGDFTLSNIVVDDDSNAKIIDINRRGCPVGWEPPEATPLIQCDQRISMYIGVKSDLFQLGMVLWALATQYDDPEAHGRPLHLGEDAGVPQWYRSMVETCLAEDPRERSQALQLLHYFPRPVHGLDRFEDSDYEDDWVQGPHRPPPFYAHSAPSVDNNGEHGDAPFVERERSDSTVDKFSSLTPIIRTVTPGNDWAYVSLGHTYVDPSNGTSHEPYYYPTRGRSPPRARTRSRSRSGPRSGSPENQRPRSPGPQTSQNRGSRRSSVPVQDPAAARRLAEREDAKGEEEEEEEEEAVGRPAPTDLGNAAPTAVNKDGAAPELSPETAETRDAASREAAVPGPPDAPSEPNDDLETGGLPRATPAPAGVPTTEKKGVGSSSLLSQIKGVGAVYEDSFPRHLTLHDDEKGGLEDDPHRCRVNDELNALVTA